MTRAPARRPSGAMVVALIALVVALGGTAVAASKLVSGDSLIKKGSLSGNRLRKHTLTGTQIDVTKLGTVPAAAKALVATSATNASHASTADAATTAVNAGTAANAAELGGVGPSAYASAGALSYTPATLQSPWTALTGTGIGDETLGYAKDAFGIVHLKGIVTGGANLSTVFTLPAGFRPAAAVVEPVAASGGDAILTVDPTGQVLVTNEGGSNVTSLVSVWGVTFSGS